VTDADSAFGLSVGFYTGGVKGYWVRFPPGLSITFAWQAIPGSPFSFWNEDRQAQGNPQDDEMFYFEVVDYANSTVRIRSRYCKYLHLDDTRPTGGASFNTGADAAQAAVFTVVFLP
jgi:hypothetical protein